MIFKLQGVLMKDLKYAKIYRGGYTASSIMMESEQCSFRMNGLRNALDFHFHIASKGGGMTRVLLRVGIEDLPIILEDVAKNAPGTVSVFASCAALAGAKNLEILNEAQRRMQSEHEGIEKLIEQLEVVKEFVHEKYMDAAAGEDERRTEIQAKLREVLSSLHQIVNQ